MHSSLHQYQQMFHSGISNSSRIHNTLQILNSNTHDLTGPPDVLWVQSRTNFVFQSAASNESSSKTRTRFYIQTTPSISSPCRPPCLHAGDVSGRTRRTVLHKCARRKTKNNRPQRHLSVPDSAGAASDIDKFEFLIGNILTQKPWKDPTTANQTTRKCMTPNPKHQTKSTPQVICSPETISSLLHSLLTSNRNR